MKKIIEKMVRQEIKDILAENEISIKEMVKESLLPELKAAVRDSVHKALEDLIEKPLPFTAPEPQNSDITQPTSASGPEGPTPRRDIGHRTSDLGPPKGRYLYCIADTGEAVSLGNIGIEENEVYSIPYDDLCAVVHNCPARPYQTEDKEIVKGWVLSHQKVVDAAWEKFGTVIPIGFDTIIQGKADATPEENMEAWLKEDYDNLKAKMGKIREKAEYGVQIFWETRIMAHGISEESAEIKALQEEIKTKPKGIAYMYRQKLEELLKKEMESKADQCFQEFYEKIKHHADDLHVEKTKKAEDENQQMLLNLSCLLPGDQSKSLGEELEKIDALEGFSVRYTGPWPPYSFV